MLASHLALHELVIDLFFMNEHLAFKAQVRKSKNKIHVDNKHGLAGIRVKVSKAIHSGSWFMPDSHI